MAKSQEIFKVLKGKLGMVPNLYATIGFLSNALESLLAYSETAGQGVLSKRDRGNQVSGFISEWV